MPNHWISTCNPKRWDIWGFLDDGNSLSDIENWSVSRYFVDMAEDEDAVLWVAGEKRGVYAVGIIAGVPHDGTGGEYWVDEHDGARRRDYIPLGRHTDVSERPLLAEELKVDPRFADATVITFPRAGNPPRLDDRQWQAMRELEGHRV